MLTMTQRGEVTTRLYKMRAEIFVLKEILKENRQLELYAEIEQAGKHISDALGEFSDPPGL
jgi:hypothetical protein